MFVNTRLFLIALAAPLMAQPGTSLLTREDFIQNWKTSKEFTLAVADQMPENLYGFKPNPAEMNFASLMIHIADSNRFRFAQVSGDKTPAPPAPKQWNKASIIEHMRHSFDYCIEKMAAITDAQLKAQYQVDWYERPQTTGSQILLGMYVHTAHHRAQAEVYMRANNIKPPDYRP
jgi:uncharacterized damage-inducible protein DinB